VLSDIADLQLELKGNANTIHRLGRRNTGGTKAKQPNNDKDDDEGLFYSSFITTTSITTTILIKIYLILLPIIYSRWQLLTDTFTIQESRTMIFE
jgi:hypothetical protein